MNLLFHFFHLIPWILLLYFHLHWSMVSFFIFHLITYYRFSRRRPQRFSGSVQKLFGAQGLTASGFRIHPLINNIQPLGFYYMYIYYNLFLDNLWFWMSFFHTDVLRCMQQMRYKEEALFLPACSVQQGSAVFYYFSVFYWHAIPGDVIHNFDLKLSLSCKLWQLKLLNTEVCFPTACLNAGAQLWHINTKLLFSKIILQQEGKKCYFTD